MTDRPIMDYARAARDASDATWRRIEAEAAEQVRAEVAALELVPLVFGGHIAWAECAFGRTDAITSAHRVGFPIGDTPYTSCGEKIPPPLRWLPLSPALVESLGRCRFCEAEYERAVKHNARRSREQAA